MVVVSGRPRSEQERLRELVELISRQFPELTRAEVLEQIEGPRPAPLSAAKAQTPAGPSVPAAPQSLRA